MTDEELDTYRCTIGGADGIKYIYTITPLGNQADIDIVTRCETASNIVEAGYRRGMFRAYPLLIVGGGAAGITAALTALSLGIEGIAISNGPVFFESQRNCTHRYLHPSIYRWPRSNCTNESYTPPGVGLVWKADIAENVVAEWDEQTHVLTEDGRYKRVNPIPNKSTVNSTEDVTKVILTEHKEQEWGMVLFCIAPKEKTTIGHFTGNHFWEADNLDDYNCGCKSERHSLLICGSGDGALQDFLRVTCPGLNIQLLHQHLDRLLNEVTEATANDLHLAIKEIGEISVDNYEEIHHKCGAVIDKLLMSTEAKKAVARFEENVLKEFPSQRFVTLAWTRDFFRKCYLLNRFLTLLVGKCMKEKGQVAFVNNARLVGVESDGTEYRVLIEPPSCEIHGGSYSRVVPRFGVEDFMPVSSNGTLLVQKKSVAARA